MPVAVATSRWRLALRMLLLFVLNGFVFVVVNALMPSFNPLFPPLPPPEAAQLPVFMLVFLVARTVVLVYLVRHLSEPTMRAGIVLALLLFGLETALMQFESVWFRSAFPLLSNRYIGIFLLSSLLEKLIIVPIAIKLLHGPVPVGKRYAWSTASRVSWHRSWLVLALVYVCIYFLFGYFIAWQSPELRQFYSGSTRLDSFLTHMQTVSPWLLLFQFGRGLGWLLLASLLANLYRGNPRAFRVSLLLIGALLIPVALLLPNPIMPEAVRYAHVPEMVFSNALWFWLVGRYVYRPQIHNIPMG